MSTRVTKVFGKYADFNDKVMRKNQLAALCVCTKIVIEANEKVVTAIQAVMDEKGESTIQGIKTRILELITVRDEAVGKVVKDVYDKRNGRDVNSKLVEFKKGSDIFLNVTDEELSGTYETVDLDQKIKDLETELSLMKEKLFDSDKSSDDYKSEILVLKRDNVSLLETLKLFEDKSKNEETKGNSIEIVDKKADDNNTSIVLDTNKSYSARLDPNTPKFHGKTEEDIEEWFDKVEVNLEVARFNKSEWMRRMNGYVFGTAYDMMKKSRKN